MDRQHENVRDITADEFPQAVLQRSREVPVVVDFWAEWCGPCRVLGPLLEKAAGAADGVFELVKVDVDQNQELAGTFAVKGIPTVIGFRDGAPVGRFSGAIPESALNDWLEEILPDANDLLVDAARDAVLEGDPSGAESLFLQVLDAVPYHSEAGTGLASLLIARDEIDEALIVLGKLTPSPEVDRLQAAARLTVAQGTDLVEIEARVASSPDDDSARIDLARALAARSEYEPALDKLLEIVRAKSTGADDARRAMLDIFGVLGDQHPLTATYRRQLANALY